MIGGQSTYIPLKVNTANVIPVIFASSIMSFPVVISQFFTIDPNSIGSKILMVLNSGSWCRPEYLYTPSAGDLYCIADYVRLLLYVHYL